jgi:hypothetical protein
MNARIWGALALAVSSVTLAQRPDESSMFGDDPADVGVADAPIAASGVDAGASADRDSSQLAGTVISNKFDTDEAKADPIKIGGSLNMFGQGYWQEGKAFEKGSFSAPSILDVFLDARPSDRVRAFANGRLQFDPTRPAGNSSSTSTATTGLVGLTPSTASNPSVTLDQLWLRFDIMRKVYVTVGRQKVRWGTARIWYPTDFLNSQPRDALNPFDVRLGVNMLKLHVPVESLGWNFYGYGIMDAVNVTSAGVTIDQLGGAVRGEFVLGPAEIGLGGIWQKGRRPRYGVDVSSSLGPFDLYAEAAFRDARDFTLFHTPEGLNADNLIPNLGNITAYHPAGWGGLVMQVSGGATFQFNYTDKLAAIVGVEYYFNPIGYDSPVGYQVQTFAPGLLGVKLDPLQTVSLYQGKHNLAVTLASPGVPGYDWITVSLTNVVIINDPAALTRVDVIFRVLSYLNVQAFASVFYGQTGGQLRFNLSTQTINDIANLAQAAPGAAAGTGDSVRSTLSSVHYPPVVQAGVILRVSI